jgi:predicted Holliday junction resolvase-like endonuclease
VILTALLVLVGALGIGYAIKTLRAVERQAKANEGQLTEIQQSAEKTDRMILLAAQEAENGKAAVEAARQSAEAARESIMLTHRPRVVVRSVIVAWEHILTRGVSVKRLNETGFDDGQLGGAFYLVNVGNQPATVIGLEQYLSFDVYLPLERPYESGTNQQIVAIKLKPGEACKLPFRPKAIVTGDQTEVIQFGKPMCAIGRIMYVDELGNRRETGFARQFRPSQQRFVAVDDPDYEYAD